MWKTVFRRNRFILIALILFLVLVTFVDKNNLLDNWRLRGKIHALEEQRTYYLRRIEEDSLVLDRLQDARYLERYAREHFYMKRPEETIYLLPLIHD